MGMLVEADLGGDPGQRGSGGQFDEGTRTGVPATHGPLHGPFCVVTQRIAPCVLGPTVAISAGFRVRSRDVDGTNRGPAGAAFSRTQPFSACGRKTTVFSEIGPRLELHACARRLSADRNGSAPRREAMCPRPNSDRKLSQWAKVCRTSRRLPTENLRSCFCAGRNSGFVAAAFAGTLDVGIAPRFSSCDARGRSRAWAIDGRWCRERGARSRGPRSRSAGSARKERGGGRLRFVRWVGGSGHLCFNRELTHKVKVVDPPPV